MERETLKLALEKIERFITKQGYFDDFADEITAIKEALAQPAQEPAIPSTQDAASKVGPFWQEFSVVYEAIGRQQITIREIAWRCFLAAKITTQPAQEPVAWMYPDALCDRACLYVCTKAFTQFPECATTPPQPAQEPVAVLFQDGSIVKLEDLEFVPEKSGQRVQMLYAAPPQRPWVGLEGEEIRNLWEEATKPDRSTVTMVTSFARAIEAKLKEKNT